MGEAEPDQVPPDPYTGMNREDLTKILERAGGKPNQVENPEAFRRAWQAAKAGKPEQRDAKREGFPGERMTTGEAEPVPAKGLILDPYTEGFSRPKIDRKLFQYQDLGYRIPKSIPRMKDTEAIDLLLKCQTIEKNGGPISDEKKINISNRHLREKTELAIIALQKDNIPPKIFIRSGSLVRIKQDEKGTPSIEICNPVILRNILARSADFCANRSDGSEKPISPPLEVVQDILVNTDWTGFPAIEGIIESPVILPEGVITEAPGYYLGLHMLYIPSQDLQLPAIPERPGPEDIAAAIKILNEIFIDFPFCDEASRTNTLAALLTAVLRPVIPGFVPLALIDKPQPGIGASLMTDVIAMIATGRPPAKMTAPTDESEWRKTITARLSQGQGLIIIDNVDKRLESGSLASVLTSETWNDRVLGQSATIQLTNKAFFIANGINVLTSNEIARRVYWIRIDAHQARPDQRTAFVHPELLSWVKTERGRILAAVLTLARAWVQAGNPPPVGIPQMGSFERWRGIVGGILSTAEIPGFLGNLEQFRERSDTLTTQWDSFLQQLKEEFPASFTAKDVKARLETYSDDRQRSLEDPVIRLCDVIPDDIPLKDKDPSRAIGKAFTRRADHVFPSGIVLRKEEKKIHQAVAWRIETTK